MQYKTLFQILVAAGAVRAQFNWGDFNWGNFGFGNDNNNDNNNYDNNNNNNYNSNTNSNTNKVAPSTFFDENGAYFGPDCDQTNYSGAYYTGDYTSPFKTYLGKTDEEIQKKLDQLWNHYFKGNNNSKVFYDQGNEGYILDVNNNDVRSEGMSYGMMICVQTDHREEFDKIWNWAKNHMWHKSGSWDGYFAWKRGSNGYGGDDNCAPDGEMYFMMSLLFAANRWNNKQYMDDAQYILKRMWDNSQHSLFNPRYNVITFQPQGNENNFSDPSYDLPAFVDLFSRWSTTNQGKWKAAASATRDHLYKSSNTKSGLFSDYNNFDGTPHSVSYNSNAQKYMYDAMRCAMNFGMDYYLFGADAKRQTEMARRLIDFFEKDGYQHARFNWDGSNPSEQYTLGEVGANAVATYALMGVNGYEDIIKKNLKMAWDGEPMTGQYRYYDGLVHYLSMLHLTGSFKIWKPAPNVQEKSITSPYNGKTYNTGDVVDIFEDCKLYKATVSGGSTPVTPNPPVGGKSKCSSKITSQGYSCCSASCEIVYTDDDGTWGVENGDWCGCGGGVCEGAQGYPCCENSTIVYYTDDDGDWSVEIMIGVSLEIKKLIK